MEVTYTANGFDTKIVSMPMPVGNQQVEEIVKAYSPVRQWENSLLQVTSVQVGHTGEVLATVPETPSLSMSVGRFEFKGQ
jgi:hypothetical protein